jgi:hypothetical protein
LTSFLQVKGGLILSLSYLYFWQFTDITCTELYSSAHRVSFFGDQNSTGWTIS